MAFCAWLVSKKSCREHGAYLPDTCVLFRIHRLKTISFTILTNGKTRPTGDSLLQTHRGMSPRPGRSQVRARYYQRARGDSWLWWGAERGDLLLCFTTQLLIPTVHSRFSSDTKPVLQWSSHGTARE